MNAYQPASSVSTLLSLQRAELRLSAATDKSASSDQFSKIMEEQSRLNSKHSSTVKESPQSAAENKRQQISDSRSDVKPSEKSSGSPQSEPQPIEAKTDSSIKQQSVEADSPQSEQQTQEKSSDNSRDFSSSSESKSNSSESSAGDHEGSSYVAQAADPELDENQEAPPVLYQWLPNNGSSQLESLSNFSASKNGSISIAESQSLAADLSVEGALPFSASLSAKLRGTAVETSVLMDGALSAEKKLTSEGVLPIDGPLMSEGFNLVDANELGWVSQQNLELNSVQILDEEDPLASLVNMIASSVMAQNSTGEGTVASPATAELSRQYPFASAAAVLSRAEGSLAGQAQGLLAEAEGKQSLTEEPSLATSFYKAATGSEKSGETLPASPAPLLNQPAAQIAAATLEPLFKSIKGQLENALSSDSKSSPLTAVNGAESTLGRGVDAQKTLQNSALFTLPNQAKGALGQPQWHTAIAERVAIMASQRITSAEIQLDPPELGHLHVRVSLNQDQANVSFVSQHAQVREALDQTAFRLREMFQAEGMNLVDVDVSGQSFAQQQQSRGETEYAGVEGEEAQVPVQVLSVSDNLVDHFV